jgi:hypothetical protein
MAFLPTSACFMTYYLHKVYFACQNPTLWPLCLTWIRIRVDSLDPDPYLDKKLDPDPQSKPMRIRNTCGHAGMPLLPEGVQQSARPYQAWSPQACPAGIPHLLPLPKLQLQDIFRYQESYQVRYRFFHCLIIFCIRIRTGMDRHWFASPAKRNFFTDPSYQLFKNAFFLPCYLCFSLIWNLLHTGYLFVLIKERRNEKFRF